MAPPADSSGHLRSTSQQGERRGVVESDLPGKRHDNRYRSYSRSSIHDRVSHYRASTIDFPSCYHQGPPGNATQCSRQNKRRRIPALKPRPTPIPIPRDCPKTAKFVVRPSGGSSYLHSRRTTNFHTLSNRRREYISSLRSL